MLNLLPLLLSACTPSAPDAWPRVTAPTEPRAPSPAVSLADDRAPVELVLPPSTWPGGEPAPDGLDVVGPWTKGAAIGDHQVWRTALPVDFHLFLQRQTGARTFGFYAPEGLDVAWQGRPLPFERNAKSPGTWGYTPELLFVSLPASAGPPEGVHLEWPKAGRAERELHLATAQRTPTEFALRQVQQGTDSFSGVLLPAPGTIAWEAEVPAGAVFAARTWLLPPAMHVGSPSDGATLRVELQTAGSPTPTVLGTWPVGTEPTTVRVPAGHTGAARVRLVVEPGASADHDLVFIEDPTLYVPTPDPQRVVLAFVDTVRPDHLGMYGYARPTSPKLDAWAAGAARFEQARTVSPWTLPSAMAVLSGRQPEDWRSGPTLPERFSAAGFRTHAIVANAYLSQVFGVDRGFDAYHYRILQPAAQTVDQALAEIARWPDRDLFLLVQFMEAHLPYEEPEAYRGLFTGAKPDALGAVARTDLVRFRGHEPDFPAVRDHVVGRYDQNLRVLDDEVSRLFAAVGPQATTVLFSDHGEEFWDHQGFEHGHSFYDELLHVPLVVRSPAMPEAVDNTPVSLLDVAPTVLDLTGLGRPEGLVGLSLRAVVAGDAAARAEASARPQAFGRPLYGDDGWAVLDAAEKWTMRGGEQHLRALTADPHEAADIASTSDLSRFPAGLAKALGREVVPVYRLTLKASRFAGQEPVELRVRHPEGIAAVWSAYDPKGLAERVVPVVEGGEAVLRRPAGERPPEELFIQPNGPLTGNGLQVVIRFRGEEVVLEGSDPPTALPGARQIVLSDAGWKVVVDRAVAPVPGGTAVRAWDAEVEGALRELGYVE